MNPYEKEQYELKEQWIGMLTMIDMVSKDAARNIANIYSCPRALYEAYQKCSSEKERRMLLTNIIRPGTNQKSLSNHIYEIIWSTDPTLEYDKEKNNKKDGKITNFMTNDK
jgi:hypothetical protein